MYCVLSQRLFKTENFVIIFIVTDSVNYWNQMYKINGLVIKEQTNHIRCNCISKLWKEKTNESNRYGYIVEKRRNIIFIHIFI